MQKIECKLVIIGFTSSYTIIEQAVRQRKIYRDFHIPWHMVFNSVGALFYWAIYFDLLSHYGMIFICLSFCVSFSFSYLFSSPEFKKMMTIFHFKTKMPLVRILEPRELKTNKRLIRTTHETSWQHVIIFISCFTT